VFHPRRDHRFDQARTGERTGAVPQDAWLHLTVLLAYAVVSLYVALALTRRRLLQ
jgi:hypothetical protein